jgi:beta-phosphoglucomutase-like phosphatase (HAD superfamily)
VLAAVEKLGLSPAECAMVGDTPYDGLSARRAGVLTLACSRRGSASTSGRWCRRGRGAPGATVGHLGAELDDALRTLAGAAPAPGARR